jgi:hypothetical protein
MADSPARRQHLAAYLFGACDCIRLMHKLTLDEGIGLFLAQLEGEFPFLLAGEGINQLMQCFSGDGPGSADLRTFLNAGGHSVLEWSQGNTFAPGKVLRLLDGVNQ